MNQILLFLLAFITVQNITAQNEPIEPVKWNSSISYINEDEIELKFEATIDEDWSLYSQFIEGDGPIPTSINYKEELELIDTYAKENSPNRTENHDEMFDMELIKYKEALILSQKIKINKNINTINGYVEYMCCNEMQCIFPEPYNFTFNLKK